MQSEFIKILDDIDASKFDPEKKGKLQSATMLLWSLQDAKQGGTGVVTWNGIVTSAIPIPTLPVPPQSEPPIPIPTPIPTPTPTDKQKEIKPKKTTRPKLNLEKDLNIKLSEINIDDL
jgi:hypothetical protein